MGEEEKEMEAKKEETKIKERQTLAWMVVKATSKEPKLITYKTDNEQICWQIGKFNVSKVVSGKGGRAV